MRKVKKKLGKKCGNTGENGGYFGENEENWLKKMRKIGEIFVPQIKIRGHLLLLCIFCSSDTGACRLFRSKVKRVLLAYTYTNTNIQTYRNMNTDDGI